MNEVSCDRCNGEGSIVIKGRITGKKSTQSCHKCRGTGSIDIEFDYQGEEP